MGGSLVAHSDSPGQGARFTIDLPCAPPMGYSGSSTELPNLKSLVGG
jgi:hypothetical protein